MSNRMEEVGSSIPLPAYVLMVLYSAASCGSITGASTTLNRSVLPAELGTKTIKGEMPAAMLFSEGAAVSCFLNAASSS